MALYQFEVGKTYPLELFKNRDYCGRKYRNLYDYGNKNNWFNTTATVISRNDKNKTITIKINEATHTIDLKTVKVQEYGYYDLIEKPRNNDFDMSAKRYIIPRKDVHHELKENLYGV